MKKRYLWLLFLVVPLLLGFIHLYFTKTVDDHHYAINMDPDYVYLLSSIDIARLQKSNWVVHPGTTLQVMSQLIMRCAYAFSDNSGDDFQTSVLKNPVLYLNVLHSTYASLNIILVFFLGLLTYKITKKILAGLLIQFTPLLCPQIILFGFRRVSVEVLLVFISLIMVLVLVKILPSDGDKKKIYQYSIILGLITGFGAATKITFLMLAVIPLIIIPLIIPRIIYLLSTIISGFIFTLPISSKYIKLFEFLQGIFSHTGYYGRGEKAIIDLNKFIINLFQIVKENLPFIIILLTAAAFITAVIVSSPQRKTLLQDIRFKMLLAVTIVQMISIIVVAKHFKSRYLIPALCLSGLLIYLIYINFTWIYREKSIPGSARRRPIIYFAVSFFLLFSLVDSFLNVVNFQQRRYAILKESIEIQRKIKNEFEDFGIIHYNHSPSVIWGLEFGHRFIPFYADALKKIYGDRYFYHVFSQSIYNWGKKNKFSLEEIKAKYNNKVILVGYPFDYFFRWNVPIQMPNFPLKDVFEGKHFTVYIVVDNQISKTMSP